MQQSVKWLALVVCAALVSGCPGATAPTPGADSGSASWSDSGSSPWSADGGSGSFWSDTTPTNPPPTASDLALPPAPPVDAGGGAPAIDPALGAYIDKMYLKILKRAPDQAGKAYWAGQYASALPSCQQLVQAFVAAPEPHLAIYSFVTDSAFLENLYQALLWRPADAGGLSYWLSGLAAKTHTRELVVQSLIASPEFAQNCTAAGLTSK
jgi:hypothetical protein